MTWEYICVTLSDRVASPTEFCPQNPRRTAYFVKAENEQQEWELVDVEYFTDFINPQS